MAKKRFSIWQMEFLHPAMWHVALGWHDIEFAQTSAIIGILHLVPISTTSPPSTCHSAPVSKILSKAGHRRQKKITSCRFSRWRISAILDFTDPISYGFFEKPNYITSYRLTIDTIAVNCLVFEKIAFFCILATDRQRLTDKQTNRWTAPMH